MSILEAIFLGILQGLTEFLPISSSGHLVIAESVANIKAEGIAFEVFVHFGTLLSIIYVYRVRLVYIFQSIFKGRLNVQRKNLATRVLFTDPNLALLLYLAVGTFPVAIVGAFFLSEIEAVFHSPRLALWMLILTGVVLWLTRFSRTNSDKTIGFIDALLVGIAQAFAVLPGISRSGVTISTALYRGVNNEKAAEFSFLLAIPAILGATLIKLIELIYLPPTLNEFFTLTIGTIAAFLSGVIAIRILLRLLTKNNFSLFAYYCLCIAICGLFMLG